LEEGTARVQVAVESGKITRGNLQSYAVPRAKDARRSQQFQNK